MTMLVAQRMMKNTIGDIPAFNKTHAIGSVRMVRLPTARACHLMLPEAYIVIQSGAWIASIR